MEYYWQAGVVIDDSEIRLSPNVWDTEEEAQNEAEQQSDTEAMCCVRPFVRWWDRKLGRVPPLGVENLCAE